MRFSQDTMWTTYEGRKLRVLDMEDPHLVNLIYFLVFYKDHPARELIWTIMEEIRDRGISNGYLMGGPYPHVDQQGNLVIWDFTKHRPVLYKTPEVYDGL